LLRVRELNIPLTICVDKVAASGGYLMSCVANQIIAAPFAIIGSIGVVAQVPNFNKLLKKYDVDYKEYTAGDFKRTVSIFGEITPKGEQKFVDQLEDTHKLFKEFVSHYRPNLNLSEVATGEYWYGERAKKLGLIDKIQTSDDYLLAAFKDETPIYEIKHEKKRPLSEKISDIMGQALAKGLGKITTDMETKKFF
jgi:serine protease SohB